MKELIRMVDDEMNRTLEKSHARYEALRRLNPREFTELYRYNLSSGVSFDSLVDKLIEGKLTL